MTDRPGGYEPQRVRVGACLSLSGRFARFGSQAACGLEAWQSLDGTADLIVEDDRSDPDVLESALRRVARQCDVLLGPYSTQLARRAGRVAADTGRLLWNHGGSGDDVQAAFPGHVVSVLTPTSQYAQPFLRYLAGNNPDNAPLLLVHGKGSFGKQITAGAESLARRLGITTRRVGPETELVSADPPVPWNLFCAGSFEEDIVLVQQARALPQPPRTICAVAAGVREFAEAVADPGGVFGIAQWFPGGMPTPDLGPTEASFLAAYAAPSGGLPDYPAVQAVAGAALAVHCARQAGGTTRKQLWNVASALDAQTLFGSFKINPRNGAQARHETVLLRWTAGSLILV